MNSAPLNRTLPAVPGSVTELRRVVADFCAEAGAAAAAVERVRLAVTEAAANVVLHAYVGHAEPGPVRVVAAVRDDHIHVTVTDEGRGMVPRVDSPGLGLGLPLIVQATESFDVKSAGGGGTEVRMSFRLAGAPLQG